MTFRLKIIKVGKFPTSWNLTKFQVLVPMGSSRCVNRLFYSDRQASTVEMPRKSPFLFLSPLSLSPSLARPLLLSLPLFFFLFLIHLHFFLLFALILISFFIFFFFSFPFLYSLFSHFQFSFIFFFSSLYLILIHRIVQKVGETFPHFPPCYVLFTIFPYFHDFSFPIISSFDTWLNESHSHKCTTWLMPCVTPLRC